MDPEHFGTAAHYDLLLTSESLRLGRDPGLLRAECAALPDGAWIVLDEVQRVPALLDEVQHLMTTKRQRFVLSGSSARKLKRGGANMLAGRAELRLMFPLVSAETGVDQPLDAVLANGRLPLAVVRARPAAFLKSYCEVYLREEVQAEALVRQIGPSIASSRSLRDATGRRSTSPAWRATRGSRARPRPSSSRSSWTRCSGRGFPHGS